jgi:Holliday junction resolvasome RuvABC endonuclease subunit
MSEQIIKLAQANDPIINNLVDTENRLNELNQEVGVILEEYNTINQAVEPSFFNFDNPFFLLTLVGLLMLAFALWFLKQELKYYRPKKNKKIKATKPEIKVAPIIKYPEPDIEPKKIIKKPAKKTSRKIKVVKVK